MEQKYLIIGGTTKAATTSLFNYLAAHPDTCPASLKETRFFLDPEYPVPVKRRFPGGLEDYDALFADCTGRLRVEATPDYLYSAGTPRRVRDTLVADTRFVFTLRNPVTRLASWYRFACQNGQLPSGTTFEDYVRNQLRMDSTTGNAQHLMVLEQGRYSRYLRSYLELFGTERVLVVLYEEVARSPVKALGEICAFAGLSAGFYATFNFDVHNRTRNMRYPGLNRRYRQIHASVRRLTYKNPLLHRVVRRMGRAIQPVYFRFNSMPDSKVRISASTQALLVGYYQEENSSLMKLLGLRAPPWPDLGCG